MYFYTDRTKQNQPSKFCSFTVRFSIFFAYDLKQWNACVPNLVPFCNPHPGSNIKYRTSSIEIQALINKSIDNQITLAYVPLKFQIIFHAPVAQPG